MALRCVEKQKGGKGGIVKQIKIENGHVTSDYSWYGLYTPIDKSEVSLVMYTTN